MFWLRWCRRPCTCRQETRILSAQIHARTTSWSECKRELQRPENEQLLVATHPRRVLLGIGYRLNAKQNFDWLLCATFSHGFSGVPETANADGRQSPSMWMGTESKFFYHSRTSVVIGPKMASEAISEHQISPQKFHGGSMPLEPPSLILHANACTRVQVPLSQTNAVLLPLGLEYQGFMHN